MAKRFIDTNLFADEWFSELSKEGKLFFLYFITNCDHAGILRLNKKLCEFQTGIKSLSTVIEELGKSLVTIKDGLLFMPKFLKFQYPEFPKSNVQQQQGALKILHSHGITDEILNSYLTVAKDLTKSYVYVNDNDNVAVIGKEEILEEFKMTEEEQKLWDKLDAFIKSETPQLLNFKDPITPKEYFKLRDAYQSHEIEKALRDLDNYKGASKKYVSVYKTLNKWISMARERQKV